MVIKNNQNPKTVFTRMCIGEAIIRMLQKEDFSKLKISEIARTAGVARMTFYKYYESPYDALTDYLSIIVGEYMQKNPQNQNSSSYMEYDHIREALLFFDQYAEFFLILNRQNLYGIMMDGVNLFMEENIKTQKHISVYELYAYAGALLNTFIKWEERGKMESPDEVAACIYHLYHRAGNSEREPKK